MGPHAWGQIAKLFDELDEDEISREISTEDKSENEGDGS